MNLTDFAGILPVDKGQTGSVAVSGISSDSRTVQPGFLFFAVPGVKADGAAFAAEAAKKGAAAIVVGKSAKLAALDVPVLTSDDPRRALALAAARFCGRQPETMVAV